MLDRYQILFHALSPIIFLLFELIPPSPSLTKRRGEKSIFKVPLFLREGFMLSSFNPGRKVLYRLISWKKQTQGLNFNHNF